nr:endoglucanase 25-like [Quercus suber]
MSSSDIERPTVRFVHTISESGRPLPSSSQWNSIEINYNLIPKSETAYDSLPSSYSKSIEFHLIITGKKYFKRFIYISGFAILLVLALVLLKHFLPHKHAHHGTSRNLTLAISQALTFFDAQKSGNTPSNSPVKFQGDSRLQDGSSTGIDDLVGGIYDSRNSIKFSFPIAYTVTLLSWTVIEYHQKYNDIGELDHVKDIIKWGSDYLLKLFVPPNATFATPILYSQVGSANNDSMNPNGINCWERPKDMTYQRPASTCDITASDLVGEIVAALSVASLVLKDDKAYSKDLVDVAEKLFELATNINSTKQGTYTTVDAYGGEARNFYNSSGYLDELICGGTWLFFATGNTSNLEDATRKYDDAKKDKIPFDEGIFYWNNKFTANSIILTRLRFFHDVGYPYEDALLSSSNLTNSVMCSYLFDQNFDKTQGGLILLKPDYDTPLQFAATAAFLSKLYSDYLDLLRRSGGMCSNDGFSVKMLRSFSMSQVNYILGDNPMKMSYMVGFGDHFPTQVHHRSSSIPWDNQHDSEGDRWLNSVDPNPNVLLGAMVAGPDQNDSFIDQRDKPQFTEPTISSNAGLVAALIALHDPPSISYDSNGFSFGIDQLGIFEYIRIPTAP